MRPALVLVVLAACDFAATDGKGPGPGPADPDAPPPVTCGDITCGTHASCNPSNAACECDTGFAGDGHTCADVDECATNNGGCPAACENTVGGRTCYAPATCAELKLHVPEAVDGTFTLYLGGNAAKPWTAHCADMATTPVEYLPLTGSNFSQYTAGGDSPGNSVRTDFTRVRFHADTLTIDIGDRRFASSMGTLDHSSEGTMVTSMPYATAMDCRTPNSNTGTASIDLRGTKFHLSGTASFARGGNQADSTISIQDGNQTATMTGGGFCGWLAPTGAPVDPFNNRSAGVPLAVTYQ